MRKPEPTIYITKIDNLKYWRPRFQRIYFGNEFCPNLIPSPEELKRALNFTAEHDLAFTLLTCQVNDHFLKKFFKIFPLLRKGDEIILNDWGIFNIIKKKFKKLLPNCILGKFLTNNINLMGDFTQKFLEKQGFSLSSSNRLEIESGILGYDFSNFTKLEKLHPKFKISVYYPYSYFATTRFCPTAYCDKINKPANYQNKFINYKFNCQKECQKYTFFARHPTKNIKLILKGNTWFVKQSLPLFIKKSPKVDRLVYMPTIPV